MENHTHNHEDCKKYLSLLSDYVDGDLNKDLCARLEAHMDGCENCTVVVNTLKRTVDLYHSTSAAEEASLPEDVKKRLFKHLSLDDLTK
jgi:anti-sigma factor (TIGR02949 family)